MCSMCLAVLFHFYSLSQWFHTNIYVHVNVSWGQVSVRYSIPGDWCDNLGGRLVKPTGHDGGNKRDGANVCHCAFIVWMGREA